MKQKRLLCTLVTSTVVIAGGALVACGSNDEPAKPNPGPETGVYYNYDFGNGTDRSLALMGGDKVALALGDLSLSGTYTIKDGALKIKLGGQSDIDATLESDVITFTYNSEQLKFWKDIDYTVTYDTHGGSSVPQATVKYGATAVAPSAPTHENAAFVGWTTVANGTTLYSFDAPITGNLTLHAKWVSATEKEYTLNYDLGYEGATALPAVQTVSGRVYSLPTPTRSGYTFKGWWVSQYDSADKLSYRVGVGETEFGTDTTLYAKWQKDGEVNPDITVTNSGISWERTGSEVKLIVRGPKEYNNNSGASEDKYGATGAQSKAINFAQAPAGDYEITLESGGATYKLYYKNKAVYAVSGLHVVGNKSLEYAAVVGAEKYYIDIDCGTLGHNHSMIDNGNKTTYDFSACDMKPEGITFTVYASAAGKATSVGRKLNHEAHLAAVNAQSYKLDAETGVLSWTAVENAESYAVSVNGGKAQTVTANSFNINSYDGEVKVSVVPQSHGYNPGKAAEYKYTRTSLSTPKDLRIEGSTLKWTGDSRAKEYEIKVGTLTLKTTATELDLNGENIEWQQDQEYEIAVRTLGDTAAKTSYWSNSTSAIYNTTSSPEPKYSASTVSWAYALGVDYYEVRINSGEIVKVTTNSLTDVVLTQKGENVISLRSVVNGKANAWKTVNVTAYELSFELDGVLLGKYYKAVGDSTNLPALDNHPGYDFSGWRAASLNGAAYTQEVFTGNADVKLYAAYTPIKYTVNLNYGSYGKAPNAQTSAQITYDDDKYTLPVPNVTDGRMQFIGWNAAANGTGTVYADYKGNASMKWNNIIDGYTIYAVYAEAFTYTEDGDGYMVSAGKDISKVTELVIPDTYNGKKVRSLNENAFKNCSNLVSVTIPSTVKAIPETAFDGCTNITQYKSTVSSLESDATYYATADGVLLRNNATNSSIDLMFIPKQTGDVFRVPSGVTYIRTGAFNKLDVSEIVVPASVGEIAVAAFKDCTSLTKVTFEGDAGNALVIAPNAFSNCANIEELVLPGRLTAWGENGDVAAVLNNFAKLKKITVVGGGNDSAYASDENGLLFNGAKDTLIFCPRASELTEYVVPATVLHIGDGAFGSVSINGNWSTRKLTTVTFHNQMRSIGARAFYRNTGLTSVTFAAAATRGSGIVIGNEAFYGCSGLTTLDFQETGALNDQNVYVAATTCSVKSIGNNAFSGVKAATVVLPSTLTSLGNSAFSGNNMLTSLDLGHVNSSLEFGESVFSGNTKLTSIEITPNVGVIPFSSVFKGCNIKEYDVSNNANYATDEVRNGDNEITGSVIYNSDYTQLVYIPENVNLSTYTIKDSVTSLASGIFKNRDDITTFTVPSAVRSIGAEAFSGCVNLTTITFTSNPDSASLTIGANAFQGCSKLTTISIPGRTTEMGEGLFAGSGIQTVTFEEGVTKIPAKALYNVSSLTAVTIASTVNEIGAQAFYNTGLSTVTFTPASGTRVALAIKAQAFAKCASLVSIVLPEGLQYVSESMFEDCTALTSVTIPTTVKNTNGEAGIGKSAFYNCKVLSDLNFTDGGSDAVSFGEYSLYNTMELTVIDLPKRAAPLTTGGYDLFQLSSKDNLTDQIGVFQSHNNFDQSASALQSITMAGQSSGVYGVNFAMYDGVLYTSDLSMLVLCPEFYAGTTSTVSNKDHTVTIAKQATSIRPGAFRNCKLIYNIEFEDANDTSEELPDFKIPSVSNMNDVVFYKCMNLESIAFPARLKELGTYALYRRSSDGERPAIKTITFADGCRLEAIGENALTYSELTSLVLPDGVKTIGKQAFAYSNLISITLSAELQEIGTRAFYGTKLTGIDFSRTTKLTTIGAGAFTMFTNSTSAVAPLSGSIVLPNSLTKLGEGAFKNTKITSVTVPSSVTEFPVDEDGTIKGAPFNYCTNLTSLTFGSAMSLDSLKAVLVGLSTGVEIAPSDENGQYSVEAGIIYRKSKLKLTEDENDPGYDVLTLIYCPQSYSTEDLENECLVIKANVIAIEAKAFEGRTNVKKISFAAPEEGAPVFDLAIENNAFKGSGLTEIVLPSRLNSLGVSAFEGCTSLVSASVPANLTKLADRTFYGCTSLQTISFGDGDVVMGTIGDYAFYNCKAFKGTSQDGLVLPSTTTTLGEGAFQNCIGLVHVTDNGVVTIGASAFKGCTALVDYALPANKLTTINDSAFSGCSSLRFIGTVYEIGDDVEYGLPNSVVTIGVSAFQSCYELGNYVESTAEDGTKSYSKTTDSVIKNTANSLTTIGQYAFKDCRSLVNIYIPNSVLNTGLGRTAATSAVAATTDTQVFYGCTALETVTFGASSKITIIGKNTFFGCTHLKSIVIPATVTTIGESAFQNCGQAYREDENNEFTVTFAGTALTAIGKSAFSGSGLKQIILPSSLQRLGATTSTISQTTEARVFENCTKLEFVDMSAPSNTNMGSIGTYMFAGCTNLKTVKFNKDRLAKIGAYAFENCKAFKALELENTVDFTIYGNAFKDSGVTTVTLKGTKKVTVSEDAFSGCSDLATVNVMTNSTSASTGTVTFNTGSLKNLSSLNTINVTGNGSTVFSTNAFSGSGLTKVQIKSGSPYTINGGAFNGCNGLANVAVGTFAQNEDNTLNLNAFTPQTNYVSNGGVYDTVLNDDGSVKTKTFIGYVGQVTTFTLDADTTAIIKDAFKNDTQLETVKIPASVTTVGESAFEGSAIKTVVFGYVKNDDENQPETQSDTVPAAQTAIGKNAFKNVKSLVSVDLKGVVSIGQTAFYGAGVPVSEDGNTKFDIEIPSNVTDIAANAFEGSNVVGVKLNAAYNPTGTATEKWFYNCKSLKTVEIGADVVKIGNNAFYGCTALTDVTFDENSTLTVLGTGLLSAAVATGSNVFYGCTALESISLPASLSVLPDYTFSGCTKLSSINLGMLETIGARAFDNCAANLTFAKAAGNNAVELQSDNTVILTKKTVDGVQSVTLIYDKNFDANGVLTVPDGVTDIGIYIYYNNKDITKVVLPDSIRSIDVAAFDSCTNLKTVEKMDKVTNFGYGAFQGSGITEINLSTTDEVSMDARVFNNCRSLTKFNGVDDVLTLGSNLKFYWSWATQKGQQFAQCTGIKTVNLNIPSTAYADADSGQKMFDSCTGLTKLNIGDSVKGDNVTQICAYMFNACSNLAGNVVMKKVTSFGASAFAGCTLAHFYFDGSIVTSIGSSAFPTTPATTVRVHVVNLSARPSTGWTGIAATAKYVEYDAAWPTEETPEA